MRGTSVLVCLSCCFFYAANAGYGQIARSQPAQRVPAAQAKLEFDVASVRRVEIPINGTGVPVFPVTGGIGTSDPTHIAYRGTWIEALIADAFGVRPDQISGLGSLSKERYDIVANIPEGVTKEQFNGMLGNLLRDRFHLLFHMESKTVPVYALRVAKNGPKFKESAHRADGSTVASRATGDTDVQGFPILSPGYKGIVSRPRPGKLFTTAQDIPIADLVRMMDTAPSGVGRPIVDETGLTGHYDFKIHFEWGRPATNADGVDSDPAPSIFTAVQEQLGLKLESAVHVFPQLIIDSIDREPTEN